MGSFRPRIPIEVLKCKPLLLSLCVYGGVGQALRCLVERCPSLSAIEREHHDYLLSSIQKLDSAPSRYRMGGHLSPDERTIVLVVMGKGSAAYAQTHWNEQVDRKALVGKPVAGMCPLRERRVVVVGRMMCLSFQTACLEKGWGRSCDLLCVTAGGAGLHHML